MATDRMDIAELMSQEAFQVLTEKQKFFVTRYIASGAVTGVYDARKAASESYGGNNHAAISCQLLGQKKIQRVLDLHFGRTENELESVMLELARAIKRALKQDRKNGVISANTVEALHFYRDHEKRLRG